jgi:NAD(P)H-nitrite reductase large subunit
LDQKAGGRAFGGENPGAIPGGRDTILFALALSTTPNSLAAKRFSQNRMTGSDRPQPADDPTDPRICYCMKIHRDELAAAIAAGAHTVEALREATTAGTGCGTCRSELLMLLQEMLPDQEVDPRIW